MIRAPTNNKKNCKRRPPSDDANSAIACRPRHHKNRAITTVIWDIPKPIILEIISWLDQESLINIILVSKQLYNIVCSDLGNEIEIYSVFAVTGKLIQKLVNNLHNYFLNKKIKDKFQNYSIMRFTEPNRFDDGDVSKEDFNELKLILEDNSIKMNGITSLEFGLSSSPCFRRF
jgi:hypothetical protein